jgi:hypothetical protein
MDIRSSSFLFQHILQKFCGCKLHIVVYTMHFIQLFVYKYFQQCVQSTLNVAGIWTGSVQILE